MIALSEWFLSSSALILAILVLRAVLGKKLSLRVRYALWAVVLVRLLLPFSPLTSNLSLSTISQPIQARAENKMLYAIPTRTYENEYEYDEPHYSRTEHSLSVNIGGNSYEYANYLSGGSVSHQGQRTDYFFLMPADELISAIWKLGILVTALWMLRRNAALSRSLKQNRTLFPMENTPIPVYLIPEGLPTPCLFGLFAPAVYLTPEAAADETTLRHVLAHELTHYAHKDHIWSFLRCVCLALHWYNPLVWAAAILSKRDGELACDEGAVKQLGEGERLSYGRTLLGMVARRSQRPSDLLTCSTAMAEGKKPIQQRIQLLVKRPETKRTALIFAVVLTALSLFLVFSQKSDSVVSPFPSKYDQYLSYLSKEVDPHFVHPYSDYSLPDTSRTQWRSILSQGQENLTPNCSHSGATDQFSFSLLYGEMFLDLYEMEDGCHLYLNNSIKKANAQGLEKLFSSSKCLAILPSGTVQKLRDLTAPFEPVPLTQEELDFFNTGDFFDHGDRTNGGSMNIRNQLLSSFYDDPRDIDLFQLFYCSSGQEIRSVEEYQTILDAIIGSSPFYPETACNIVTTGEMNAVLTEHMGITLEETNKVGLEYMDYLPEYDAYYDFHGDTNYGQMVHFTSGQRSGNTIWLYYQDTFGLLDFRSCVLTLYQDGDRYYFCANQPTPEAALEGIKDNLSVRLIAQKSTLKTSSLKGVEFLLTYSCPDLGYSTEPMELFATITAPKEVAKLIRAPYAGTATCHIRLNAGMDLHHSVPRTIYRSYLTEEDVNAILTTKDSFIVTITFPDGSEQDYTVALEQATATPENTNRKNNAFPFQHAPLRGVFFLLSLPYFVKNNKFQPLKSRFSSFLPR